MLFLRPAEMLHSSRSFIALAFNEVLSSRHDDTLSFCCVVENFANKVGQVIPLQRSMVAGIKTTLTFI